MSESVTIDYVNQTWGHSITFTTTDKGMTASGHLFNSHVPHKGDYLLLKNGDRTTRYRITKVRPKMDPDDMYEYEAEFAPRTEAKRD